MKAQSAARRAELRSRVALLAAAILACVGVVVFVQVRSDDSLVAPTPPTPAQLAQPDQEETNVIGKTGGVLVPEARDAAAAFLMSALRRQDLAVSWDLATRDLRGAITRKQWLAGTMPVPPFPVRSLASTRFQVATSEADKVMLEVLVLPPVGDDNFEPLRYDMTLVKQGARWRVSYIVPYQPVGMFSDSNG